MANETTDVTTTVTKIYVSKDYTENNLPEGAVLGTTAFTTMDDALMTLGENSTVIEFIIADAEVESKSFETYAPNLKITSTAEGGTTWTISGAEVKFYGAATIIDENIKIVADGVFFRTKEGKTLTIAGDVENLTALRARVGDTITIAETSTIVFGGDGCLDAGGTININGTGDRYSPQVDAEYTQIRNGYASLNLNDTYVYGGATLTFNDGEGNSLNLTNSTFKVDKYMLSSSKNAITLAEDSVFQITGNDAIEMSNITGITIDTNSTFKYNGALKLENPAEGKVITITADFSEANDSVVVWIDGTKVADTASVKNYVTLNKSNDTGWTIVDDKQGSVFAYNGDVANKRAYVSDTAVAEGTLVAGAAGYYVGGINTYTVLSDADTNAAEKIEIGDAEFAGQSFSKDVVVSGTAAATSGITLKNNATMTIAKGAALNATNILVGATYDKSNEVGNIQVDGTLTLKGDINIQGLSTVNVSKTGQLDITNGGNGDYGYNVIAGNMNVTGDGTYKKASLKAATLFLFKDYAYANAEQEAVDFCNLNVKDALIETSGSLVIAYTTGVIAYNESQINDAEINLDNSKWISTNEYINIGSNVSTHSDHTTACDGSNAYVNLKNGSLLDTTGIIYVGADKEMTYLGEDAGKYTAESKMTIDGTSKLVYDGGLYIFNSAADTAAETAYAGGEIVLSATADDLANSGGALVWIDGTGSSTGIKYLLNDVTTDGSAKAADAIYVDADTKALLEADADGNGVADWKLVNDGKNVYALSEKVDTTTITVNSAWANKGYGFNAFETLEGALTKLNWGVGNIVLESDTALANNNTTKNAVVEATIKGTYTITNNAQNVTIAGSVEGGVTNANTLTVTGSIAGKTTNNKTLTVDGGTLGDVTNTGTFNMNTGTISGAVDNDGTFNMNNGTITGAIDSSKTLTVNGGTLGDVTNSGTMTVNGGTFGTVTHSGTSKLDIVGTAFSGSLSNSGTNVQVDNGLVISGALVNNENAKITIDVTGYQSGSYVLALTATGGITNDGKIATTGASNVNAFVIGNQVFVSDTVSGVVDTAVDGTTVLQNKMVYTGDVTGFATGSIGSGVSVTFTDKVIEGGAEDKTTISSSNAGDKVAIQGTVGGVDAGVEIVNAGTMNGGYDAVTGDEIAVNVGGAEYTGDVTIANTGHLNANVVTDGAIKITENTASNTLTGNFEAGTTEDVTNNADGLIKDATFSAETITLKNNGTVQASSFSAEKLTIETFEETDKTALNKAVDSTFEAAAIEIKANMTVDAATKFAFSTGWAQAESTTITVDNATLTAPVKLIDNTGSIEAVYNVTYTNGQFVTMNGDGFLLETGMTLNEETVMIDGNLNANEDGISGAYNTNQFYLEGYSAFTSAAAAAGAGQATGYLLNNVKLTEAELKALKAYGEDGTATRTVTAENNVAAYGYNKITEQSELLDDALTMGTAGNDTLAISAKGTKRKDKTIWEAEGEDGWKSAVVFDKSAVSVDLMGGKNAVTVGSGSELKLKDLSNVSSVTIANGKKVTKKVNGVKETAMVESGLTLTGDLMTGEGTTAVKVGNNANLSAAAITKNTDVLGTNNVTVGNESAVSLSANGTALDYMGSLTIGNKSTLTAATGDLQGVDNAATSVKLGTGAMLTLDDIYLGAGKNSVTLGNNAGLIANSLNDATSLTIGNGTFDKENAVQLHAGADIEGDLVMAKAASTIKLGSFAKLEAASITNGSKTGSVGITLSIGANSDVTIGTDIGTDSFAAGAIENISGITLTAGKVVNNKYKDADGKTQYKPEGGKTSLTAGDITGTGAANTIKVGNNAEVTLGDVNLKGGKNKIDLGGMNVEFTAKNVKNVQTFKVGNGKKSKDGTYAAGNFSIVKITGDFTGVTGANTIDIGAGADVEIGGSIKESALGGSNAIKLGNDVNFDLTGDVEALSSLTLGNNTWMGASVITGADNGLKTTVTLGTGAELEANNVLDVKSFKLGTNAEASINSSLMFGDAASNTLDLGAGANFTATNVVGADGAETIKLAKNASLTADTIDLGSGKNSVSLNAAGAVLNADEISGINSLAVKSGALLTADALTGTSLTNDKSTIDGDLYLSGAELNYDLESLTLNKTGKIFASQDVLDELSSMFADADNKAFVNKGKDNLIAFDGIGDTLDADASQWLRGGVDDSDTLTFSADTFDKMTVQGNFSNVLKVTVDGDVVEGSYDAKTKVTTWEIADTATTMTVAFADVTQDKKGYVEYQMVATSFI